MRRREKRPRATTTSFEYFIEIIFPLTQIITYLYTTERKEKKRKESERENEEGKFHTHTVAVAQLKCP